VPWAATAAAASRDSLLLIWAGMRTRDDEECLIVPADVNPNKKAIGVTLRIPEGSGDEDEITPCHR
jgi:hypothetical protein